MKTPDLHNEPTGLMARVVVGGLDPELSGTDRLLNDNVRALQLNLDRLGAAMAACETFNDVHSGEAQRLARATSALMAEVRQDRRAKRQDAEDLTPEQLDEAITESYLSRSPERRRALIAKLRAADKGGR